MNGCLNPNAVNYNSSADFEDFSCLYLFKNQGNCHLFKDVLPTSIEDKSFTLSYSMLGNNWVFFHDYWADMYIHTHEQLYSLKNNTIYKHHDGPPGIYHYDKPTDPPKPFFIDIIFKMEIHRKYGQTVTEEFDEGGDMLLESVQWVTEFLANNTEQVYSTLTHISIWNSSQHTGRIPLDDSTFINVQFAKKRRNQGAWSFNAFRDLLQSNGSSFLLDLFNDYKLDPLQVPAFIPWYNRKVLQDQWFCVRFEFDNTSGQQLLLHETVIQAIKTDR